jgi:hypothetical protein
MKAAFLGALAALIVALAIAFVARRIAAGKRPRRGRSNGAVSGRTNGGPYTHENTGSAHETDSPPAGWLVCTAGPLAGQRFEIRSDGLYIGRESSLAQIVVSDDRISKRHVWVGPRGGRVTAVDQGSTNGTYLNQLSSRRVTEVFLNAGDTLILSEFDVARFQFQK